MKKNLLLSILAFNLFLNTGNATVLVDQVKYNSFLPVAGQLESNEKTDLAYFSASQKDKEVVINWKMLHEKNTAFFTVEKSVDGQNFNVLTTENGSGTVLNESEYFSVDFLPTRGVAYYRLSQTDLEGNKVIFETQTVEYKIELDIFSNQQENQYHIYGIPKKTNAQITITDKDGKEIKKMEYKDNGAILIEYQDLADGIYYIKIKDDYSEWSEIFEKN